MTAALFFLFSAVAASAGARARAAEAAFCNCLVRVSHVPPRALSLAPGRLLRGRRSSASVSLVRIFVSDCVTRVADVANESQTEVRGGGDRLEQGASLIQHLLECGIHSVSPRACLLFGHLCVVVVVTGEGGGICVYCRY
jgi:hypothetical protein